MTQSHEVDFSTEVDEELINEFRDGCDQHGIKIKFAVAEALRLYIIKQKWSRNK